MLKLYQTDVNGMLLDAGTQMLDDGQLPDEIQSDAIFTAGVTPDTSITDASFATGSSVATFTGAATDNRLVGKVTVGVRDLETGQWWCVSHWSDSACFWNASLQYETKPTTGWSTSWQQPGPGRYRVYAIAYDRVGNIDPSAAWIDLAQQG